MDKEQAIAKVQDLNPDYKIIKVQEFEKCFNIILEPENYNEKYGPFIGGSLRIDKKTGDIDLYNPMLEGMR